MDAIRAHLSTHSTALGLREERNEILASNIANAATPNFKARDMDFNASLQDALGVGSLRTTDNRHFATSLHGGNQLGYRQPLHASMDGNTVELNVEQMEFAENTFRYQTSLEMINRRISGLMMAIRGE